MCVATTGTILWAASQQTQRPIEVVQRLSDHISGSTHKADEARLHLEVLFMLTGVSHNTARDLLATLNAGAGASASDRPALPIASRAGGLQIAVEEEEDRSFPGQPQHQSATALPPPCIIATCRTPPLSPVGVGMGGDASLLTATPISPTPSSCYGGGGAALNTSVVTMGSVPLANDAFAQHHQVCACVRGSDGGLYFDTSWGRAYRCL